LESVTSNLAGTFVTVSRKNIQQVPFSAAWWMRVQLDLPSTS